MRKVLTKSFSIPEESYTQLKTYADLKGVSVSKVLTTILNVYFGGCK